MEGLRRDGLRLAPHPMLFRLWFLWLGFGFLALLPVATWNVSHPSLRVFSVDSRVSFVSSKLY